MPITTWQFEVTLVQRLHDLGNAAQLQEQLEDETEPPLHGHVGILNDDAARVRISPIGSITASSPRSASASRPAVSRLRMAARS